MTDYTALKLAADAVSSADEWYSSKTISAFPEYENDADFVIAASPSAVLALIAENERIAGDEEEASAVVDRLAELLAGVSLAVRGPYLPLKRHSYHDLPERCTSLVVERDQLKAESERLAAACERAEQIIIVECKAASLAKVRANLLEADRDQLRAEVQRLTMAVGIQTVRSFAGQTDQKSIDELLAAGIQVDKEEIARLRAEIAGLRTGYEAYERVNAELKAECEGLRNALDVAAARMLAAKVCFDRDYPGEWSGELHLAVAIKEIDAAMGKGEQP